MKMARSKSKHPLRDFMTTKLFCIISILAAMLFVGCASNQPVVQAPSPQELEWANKVIALDQQQKELQKQEKEFKELKARADSEREEAKAKNWLAQNKEEIEKQFTSIYQTNGQSILDAYGLSGIYLDCVVDDVAIDGKILIASQVIVWKNSDQSGGVARINVGYEMTNDLRGDQHFSVNGHIINDTI